MTSGVRIHQELQDFGGVNALKLEPSIKKELKTDWNLFLIHNIREMACEWRYCFAFGSCWKFMWK